MKCCTTFSQIPNCAAKPFKFTNSKTGLYLIRVCFIFIIVNHTVNMLLSLCMRFIWQGENSAVIFCYEENVTCDHQWYNHCTHHGKQVSLFTQASYYRNTNLSTNRRIPPWVFIKSHWPWWRHQMETFSALLVICAGNSPVPGEFPTQRPVTQSFDVFFDLRLNTRLGKQWWGWWFETLSRPLLRHRNAIVIKDQAHLFIQK